MTDGMMEECSLIAVEKNKDVGWQLGLGGESETSGWRWLVVEAVSGSSSRAPWRERERRLLDPTRRVGGVSAAERPRVAPCSESESSAARLLYPLAVFIVEEYISFF